MSHNIQGQGRHQVTLFPEVLDDFVSEGKLMRVIDVFVDENPDFPVLRKQTVEHPFGTLKMWMGAPHLLMKRLPNVSTEMSLHVLAYNLQRMTTILGTRQLISMLKAG